MADSKRTCSASTPSPKLSIASSVPAPSSAPVSAFRDDALGRDDAVELARRLAGGEVRAEELVAAAIERARSVDPALHAIVIETFEAALEQAKRPNEGRFRGLPTFIKDTDAVEGVPLRMGSHALPTTPSRKTSRYVEQLLSTGLISLGKTSLPELGLTATTEPSAFGATHNPWNPAHSTGGSSGGSAALVAAGVVPIAHANDGGGSIRIPAACCGLVGLKPSRGRLLGADGAGLMPVDIIVQGVVTRSVRDTAAFLAAAEKSRASKRLAPVGDVSGPGRDRLRIAVFTDAPGGAESDRECAEAALDAARLCEELGHSVERIRCPFDSHLIDDFFVFWGLTPFALRFLGRHLFGAGFDARRMENWSKGLAAEFRRNIHRVPAVVRRLRRFTRTYDDLFTRWDVLLTPTLALPPVRLGYLGPDVPFQTSVERVIRYVPFTAVQNISGGAAISLPLARSRSGLPLGVQLAGRLGSERVLLELSFELEAARPWPSLADVAPGGG